MTASTAALAVPPGVTVLRLIFTPAEAPMSGARPVKSSTPVGSWRGIATAATPPWPLDETSGEVPGDPFGGRGVEGATGER